LTRDSFPGVKLVAPNFRCHKLLGEHGFFKIGELKASAASVFKNGDICMFSDSTGVSGILQDAPVPKRQKVSKQQEQSISSSSESDDRPASRKVASSRKSSQVRRKSTRSIKRRRRESSDSSSSEDSDVHRKTRTVSRTSGRYRSEDSRKRPSSKLAKRSVRRNTGESESSSSSGSSSGSTSESPRSRSSKAKVFRARKSVQSSRRSPKISSVKQDKIVSN